MKPTALVFKDFRIKLISGSKRSANVSRSSYALSKMIRDLKGADVLDLGSGIGYMSIGALTMGAKKVVAVDVDNTEKIVRKNLQINNLTQSKLDFIRSDLFDKIPKDKKFDVIIANLPQHALPASTGAKSLKGKYGGYDGTDIVCRALSEARYYLRPRGRYYGSISELTNYERTLAIAKSLYDIGRYKTECKIMSPGEMKPFLSDKELLYHLKKLSEHGLINIRSENLMMPLTYKVKRYEFILKNKTKQRPPHLLSFGGLLHCFVF